MVTINVQRRERDEGTAVAVVRPVDDGKLGSIVVRCPGVVAPMGAVTHAMHAPRMDVSAGARYGALPAAGAAVGAVST